MRTAVVSGSASGLGAATRAMLEAAGTRVVGVDLRDADVVADLGTPDGRGAAVEAALDAVGGSLDALVPCAGLGPQFPDTATIVSVNYFGAVAMLDGLRPALARGERPAAVLISSNSIAIDPTVDGALVDACVVGDETRARVVAATLPPNAVYASSKLGLARTVRRRVQEFADAGIRVNAVAPGAFDSPLLQGGLDDPTWRPLIEALPIPLGRRGKPADIAAVVVWLLSDEARYVHGSLLYVDGGTEALLRPDEVP